MGTRLLAEHGVIATARPLLDLVADCRLLDHAQWLFAIAPGSIADERAGYQTSAIAAITVPYTHTWTVGPTARMRQVNRVDAIDEPASTGSVALPYAAGR